MRDLADRLLDAADAAGATFADCRVVQRTNQSVTVKNGRVNNVSQFEDEGCGIRVLVDGAWGFCGTQRADAAGLEDAARLAVRIARASARSTLSRVRLAPVPSVTARYTTPVVIDDHKGATISQNVVVTINGANDDPIAAADSNGTAKNSTVSVSAANGLLANDTDPDIHDQGHLFVGEVNGSATNVGHAVAGTYGSVTINANGSYVYAANQGALPSKIVAQDIFNYTVADGHGGTDTSTLSVVVFNPGVNYLAGINTTLNGGNGKNVLDGSAGHDLLIAGNSPDVLIGGVGDTLTGGNGPDTFLFRPDFGANKITDFDVNNDAIQFDKSIFTSVADLISHTSNSAGGAVISDGHGDTITLASVTLAQLQTHTSDFFFV